MELPAAAEIQDAAGVGGVDPAAGQDGERRAPLKLPQHVRPFQGRGGLPGGKDAVEAQALNGLQGFKGPSANIEGAVEALFE